MHRKATDEYEKKNLHWFLSIFILHNQLHITSTKFHENATHSKGDRSQKGATHTHTHACMRAQTHTDR